MKKILFLLFFAVFFVFNSNFASAHVVGEEGSGSSEEKNIEASSSAQKGSDYVLPYPGMLSDNPLYFIKALRDRVIETLTSDPARKADFYLLTADKRLNEGLLLFEKGSSKYQLAQTTISKGENYFEKGIGQLRQAKSQNLPVDSLIQKYHSSSHKHYEAIGRLIKRSSGGIKDSLTYSQKRTQGFGVMLEEFEPKK